MPNIYGGCGGNKNNFRSEKECAAVCQNENTGISNAVLQNSIV